MKPKTARIISIIMLIGSFIFLEFVFTHPEATFPWGNTVTYILYGLYICAMVYFMSIGYKR